MVPDIDEIWDDRRFILERSSMPELKLWSSSASPDRQAERSSAAISGDVLMLRDGRVARTDVFLDRAEALEAARLSE